MCRLFFLFFYVRLLHHIKKLLDLTWFHVVENHVIGFVRIICHFAAKQDCYSVGLTRRVYIHEASSTFTASKFNRLIRTRLTQYHHMVLVQLCCRLANEYEIMAAKEKHCRSKKKTFPAPLAGPLGRSPPKFKTGTDLCPCTKFQPNLFSSFGGDATQTDRQTDIQGEAK